MRERCGWRIIVLPLVIEHDEPGTDDGYSMVVQSHTMTISYLMIVIAVAAAETRRINAQSIERSGQTPSPVMPALALF